MPRTYYKKVLTVGDLREFLAQNTIQDSAYLWVFGPGGCGELITNIHLEKVSVPDDGHEEEEGLCLVKEKE